MSTRSQKIKIDLYDTLEKKYAMRDTGMPEAAKELGVTYNAFTNAIYRGGLVMGRYKIIKKGFFPSKLSQEKIIVVEDIKDKGKTGYVPIDFKERWNDAVKPWQDAYAERDKVKQ